MKLPLIAIALATTASLLFQDHDEQRERPPKVGDRAPAFRLNDQDGRAVQVGGESPRWTIVAFYPKALTPG